MLGIIFFIIFLLMIKAIAIENEKKKKEYKGYVIVGMFFGRICYVRDIGKNYCNYTENLDEALKFDNKEDALARIGDWELSVLKL